MVDYAQPLVPPEYRNLVINPNGDASIGASWIASNGTIANGTSGLYELSGYGDGGYGDGGYGGTGDGTPTTGENVIEYTVTNNTSSSYYFGPLGPSGDVHADGFMISPTGDVSARFNLRGATGIWVRVQASWMVMEYSSSTGAPTGLREISQTVIGTASQLAGDSTWVVKEFQILAANVPTGVTHWRPLIAVFAGDPATIPTAPSIGTKVSADEVFVTDYGSSLAGVPYVDGEQAGCIWEGIPFYSSSRTFEPDPEVPDDLPPDGGDGDGEIGDQVDPDVEPPPDSDPQVDPPVIPDAEPVVAAPRSMSTRAGDIITHERDPRGLCMRGDIQLSDLVFNTVDNMGVTWIISDIEGWWTMPEPDVPDNPRGWFDGSYEARGRYNSRTFTVNGSFFPSHETSVAMARDRLVRASNLCHRGGWFMTHEGNVANRGTMGSKVWLAGAPLITTDKADGRTDFSIALRAPDPVKYGIKDGLPPGYESINLVTSNSEYPDRAYPRSYPWKYPEGAFGNIQAIIQNYGNAIVWPILTMSGPTNGPVVITNSNTEQTFRIVRKLYPGETLIIDCHSKQVTLNGQGNYRFYLDVDVDWLMLQPGPNKLHFAEEILGGIRTNLVVQWRSGWIG